MDADLQELADCVHDLRASGYESVPSILARIVEITDRPPLSMLLRSLLPDVDLVAWWEGAKVASKGMAGRATLEWPTDRTARVAYQLAICRVIARGELKFLDFAYPFYGLRGNFDERVRWFAQVLVEPMVRDIARLSQLRTTPPVVEDLLKVLPVSGDPQLDELVRDARDKFQDKSPEVRKMALDRLWDAWERLKTLEAGDKKASITKILDSVAPTTEFRELLEREAQELTKIGNTFQIRHWERGTVPVEQVRHMDYLFHRLFALIWLILSTRAEAPGSSGAD
jgi:hypothetical protein